MSILSSNHLIGLTALAVAFFPSMTMGQSKQYQRSKPKVVTTQPDSSSQGKVESNTATSEASASGDVSGPSKVDVSDLEKKYWIPKDTEFQVVQNRTYSKAGRLAFNVSFGLPLAEFYSSVQIYGLTANYYFSERHGIQLQYLKYNSSDNETVDFFKNRYQAIPDFGRQQQFYGLAYNWVPVYAKLSLLEQNIIYFDMSFSPGIGITQYDQVYYNRPADKVNSPTLTLDVAQHFFLSRNFALRFDFKNHLFNEEVKKATNPNEVTRTRLNHTMIIQGGITFHF